MKSWSQKAILRILIAADREKAIGAISESGLFKKNELVEYVDELFSLLPIPNFALLIITDVLPSFITDIKLFIVLLTWKYLNLAPGEETTIELPPFEAIQPEETEEIEAIYREELTFVQPGGQTVLKNYEVTQEYFDKLVEDYNTLIKSSSKLQRDYNTLLGGINPETGEPVAPPVVVTPEVPIPQHPDIGKIITKVEEFYQDYVDVYFSNDPEGEASHFYQLGARYLSSDIINWLRTL